MTDLLIKISNGFPGMSNNGEVIYRRPPGSSYEHRRSEMRHSRSEDLLEAARTPSPLLASAASEDDLIAAGALQECSSPPPSCLTPNPIRQSLHIDPLPNVHCLSTADRVDPQDTIRDIVSENDLYRFVLFKRHYEKYVALANKYEEARGLTYYLEERYHEVKAEKDKIEETRLELEKRLEGCEAELRDKEEELFLQLERGLRLEDEAERVKAERDACILAKERLEAEQAQALRQLQLQVSQSEIARRTLEQARQDVVRQATLIRVERDALERENQLLKEKLQVEQDELSAERRKKEENLMALTREAAALRHAARHLRAAALHATTCRRRRRCSVCLYAKRAFADVDDHRDDGKLFKCLQTPLQDLRTWLRAPPVTPTELPPLRTSSPLEPPTNINYIDDSSSSDDEAYLMTPIAEVSLSSNNSNATPAARAFSSDSGFSSEMGDRRSRSYEGGGVSSRKVSESSIADGGESHKSGFSRARWTSSFRRLLGRKSKSKGTADRTT